MFEKLRELQKNSYVPLTNFRTAAIVFTKDGKGFPGVNVENPSFRDGLCAEQNAIAAACSHGYGKGDFSLMYLITDGQTISTPCFLCRQVINELFDPSSSIICYNTKGDFKIYTVRELCPEPFDERDLS